MEKSTVGHWLTYALALRLGSKMEKKAMLCRIDRQLVIVSHSVSDNLE